MDDFEDFGINSQLVLPSNFLFLWNLGLCAINLSYLP